MAAVRRPTHERMLAGRFALVCIGSVAAGMWTYQTDKRKWFFTAGGVPLVLLALREFRSQPGNLARWTVDAGRWQAFMQLSELAAND